MAEEKREPFESRGAPQPPGDRLRQRIAEARESIGRSLREVVDRLEEEQDIAARAAEARVEKVAQGRLEEAIAEFRSEAAKAIEEARRELTERADALEGELDRRLDARVGERVAALGDTVARRIHSVLDEVERATASVSESQRQADEVGARIEEAMAGVGVSVAKVAESETRVLEIERRTVAVEGRIADAVETATRAADWELRIEAATRIEDEVARRIMDAERRLIELLDEPPAPS